MKQVIKMKRKSKWAKCVTQMALCLLMGLSGNSYGAELRESKAIQTDLKTFTVPQEVQIVGLGEASHGVKEYHEMKAEVFKALVQNNGCQDFIIEGDFGGALKVNDYIHGNQVSAKEAIQEIGFGIYETEELVNLIEWMRAYNEKASEGKDLHFYGMDMQRFDHNKAYLFSVLAQGAPELSGKYKARFANLTDEKRSQLKREEALQAKKDVLSLMKEMDTYKEAITKNAGEEAFEFAKACAKCIYEYCEILSCPDQLYSQLRDQYMAENVKWFLERKSEGPLFINGHNGHIGKVSTSVFTALGERLAKDLGEGYYAIGTDANITTFNSQGDDGKFTVRTVENINAISKAIDAAKSNMYFIDIKKVSEDKDWEKLMNGQLRMTSLNVGIAEWQKLMKNTYTSLITPSASYNALILFNEVHPTTLI